MKKLFLTIVCLLAIVGFSFQLNATELNETLTFEWTQEDITNLKEWKLFWSNTEDGSYIEAIIIPYDSGVEGPVYSGPAGLTVNGEQATHVIKYFVLRACGDIPQKDGSVEYICSVDSNKVFYSFWIPGGVFSVPIEFKILAE